jgi:hypothetical protein
MKLSSPRTGLRPEPKRIATRFHLRIPHRIGRDSTHTMAFALSEAGFLTALKIVRTRRRRSSSVGTKTTAEGRKLALAPIVHMLRIGEYTTLSAYTILAVGTAD